MDDEIAQNNRKLKKRNDEERFNEIYEARSKFLKAFQITSVQYGEQEKYMKKIQKYFFDLLHHPSLAPREFVHVKILNGNSPRDLVVLKTIDETSANQFNCDLQRDYNDKQYELVFCLRTGMICVAKTASNGWQRCRIIRLHTKNVCTVFLLDIGISEHINWMDLRILDEKWCHQRPFAIRCSLVCVESATPIDRVTRQQLQQFTQALQAHKDFYILANRPGTITSDVFLYYRLGNQFHCVNEIFPSGLSSSDEDEIDETFNTNMKTMSRSLTMVGSGHTNIHGGDGRTFNKAEQTVEQSTYASHGMVITDQNENEMKTDNTINNDVEMKDPSHRSRITPAPSHNNTPTPIVTTKESDQKRLTKPEMVDVRHIDEMGLIFVCFKRYKNVLNTLRFDIQKHVRHANEYDGLNCDSDNSDCELAWHVGDQCLVYGRFEGIPEWLRGRITNISKEAAAANDDDQLADVYLRDVGKTVKTRLRALKAIHHDSEDSVRSVRDFTWKSRLAYIEIKHQNCRIRKVLERMLEGYDEMAISVIDSSAEQLDIILWGIHRNIRAMLPERIELTNINEELVKQGFAHTENPAIFDDINMFSTNLMNANANAPEVASNSDSDYYQSNQSGYYVTEHTEDVAEWLPSEPILRREFAAIPMYVSQKLYLSVLEANRKNIADEMKSILEKKYKANELERRDDCDWRKEDPCFVRFPADQKFYRGSVRRVNFEKNFCIVRFVDYGNCATCSFDDLRKANMFGDIPVLTRLFQLDKIRPLTENGLWPDEVVQYCSEAVVERQCNLIITDHQSYDEPILCKLEMFTRDKDLATALVTRGLADWIRSPMDETA